MSSVVPPSSSLMDATIAMIKKVPNPPILATMGMEGMASQDANIMIRVGLCKCWTMHNYHVW